ncbi:MAG: carbonic anhydrase [Synechococcaceae cyanobacterium]|nr:carbonic anhydrase [Synechococcaceae cyanobacterium]
MQRRQLLIGSAIGLTGAALPAILPRVAQASGTMDHHLLESLQVCTPKDSLTRLQEGNARFAKAWATASGKGTPEQRMHQLNSIWEQNCQIDPVALAQGQKPFAATLSCADSRVDPGWLFACGSGELFQVRSAGNTAFDDGIASLEYAVAVLKTPLVVVMGHSGCGAVKAAMASEPLTPLLEGLVKPIRASLHSGDSLTQAIQGNVRTAAGQLTSRSAVLRDAVAAGNLAIRSAYFDIASGRVSFL